MPKDSATGGAARPTGETAVRRYTAAEWAERQRRAHEALGEAVLKVGFGAAETHLRVLHGKEGTRASITARLPHPFGDGMIGQTVEIEPDAEEIRALATACEAVLAAHRGRAEGAATLAWAQHIAAQLPGEDDEEDEWSRS